MDVTTARQVATPTAWLRLAHAGWWLLTATSVLVFGAGLLLAFQAPLPDCTHLASCNPTLFNQGDAQLAEQLGFSVPTLLLFELVAIVLGRGSFFLVALVLFWKRPDDRVALMLSASLVASLVEGGIPAEGALGWAALALYAIATVLFLPLPFIFPDGRYAPVWTRWLVPLAIALVLAGTVGGKQLAWLGGSGTIGWAALAIYAMVYRYGRLANRTERDQIRWALLGLGCTFLLVPGFVLLMTVFPATQPSAARLTIQTINGALYILAYLGFAVCIAIAMLRYQLWGIELALNRSLVYAALSAFVLLAYVAIVSSLGALLQTSGNLVLAFVATAVIALLFDPLRRRVQRGVNRLMYGERDEPYAVLTQLRQQLDQAVSPQALLPAVAEMVAQALKLPYAAIRVRDDLMAECGAAPAHGQIEMFPLTYQGQPFGTLEVATRARGEALGPGERRLLTDIAAQAGVAAHAALLSADLQHARERLVSTREEERRRLRRDLHDGLGPKLAGQALILEAIRDTLPVEADQQRALVEHLIGDSQRVVSEVRQLVHGLRPPALDQMGLRGALEALIEPLAASGARARFSAPEQLPALPAAVEVALYRIAQEALTNVIKHARASSCTLTLTVGAATLLLEIADDGVGFDNPPRWGVGMLSMRERAEEIGGSCTIERRPNGGTRVIAELPRGAPE